MNLREIAFGDCIFVCCLVMGNGDRISAEHAKDGVLINFSGCSHSCGLLQFDIINAFKRQLFLSHIFVQAELREALLDALCV